ncbi:hypothetical protein B484DRAFT_458263 [Ochromonadaceae sp. CCMP2298]|nr:hypothetical protein B484DRAFT_458263 [Ochromonadaceae sp. CCMP2298]
MLCGYAVLYVLCCVCNSLLFVLFCLLLLLCCCVVQLCCILRPAYTTQWLGTGYGYWGTECWAMSTGYFTTLRLHEVWLCCAVLYCAVLCCVCNSMLFVLFSCSCPWPVSIAGWTRPARVQ